MSHRFHYNLTRSALMTYSWHTYPAHANILCDQYELRTHIKGERDQTTCTFKLVEFLDVDTDLKINISLSSSVNPE